MPGRHSSRKTGLLLVGGWLLTFAASASAAPMFTSPHEVDDPFWLSPKYRRFHEPVLPRLVPHRPAPLPTIPRGPRPAPMPLEPGGSQPFELPVQPVPRPSQPEPLPTLPRDDRGPALEPPPEQSGVQLDLAVAAPASRQAGSSVLFEIRVTNRSSEPVSDVVLEATLENGFRLPERPDRRVVRPLGTIPPGQSREAALTLVADAVGTRCASFLVTADGSEAAWKRMCVEVVPRQLDVSITGPDQAQSGARATFVVTLTNVTDTAIESVDLLVTPDAVLNPVGGSAGARATVQGLRWNLGRLAAGERVSIEIECACQAAAERACVSAQVTAAGVPLESGEHCVEITAERRNATMSPQDWQRRRALRAAPILFHGSGTGLPRR